MSPAADTPSDPVHPTALAGFSAGAELYAQGRPDYPPALLDWLRDVACIDAGCTVVDLGAGTGKFTRLLVELQARVVAVEPVAAMRARLQAELPGVTAVDGLATAMPLPEASADAVVCAQAFHWFATREALDEIARVLRPGGRLVLVWNQRDARLPWVARMDEIVKALEGEAPRFYQGRWRDAFPHEALEPLQAWHFPHAHVGAPEQVIVQRVLSTSFISALPEAPRRQVEQALRELIAAEPDLQGQDRVSVPYLTLACCARKRG